MQDTDDNVSTTNSRGLNWLPVLMLFMALLLAWGIYSSYDNRAIDSTNQQEVGIGGAPEVTETPTSTSAPTPSEEPTPTEADLIPTTDVELSPTITDEPTPILELE